MLNHVSSAGFDAMPPHPLFDEHPAVWEHLAGSTHTRIYPKDTALLHHGDAASSLWLVHRGWVKLTRQTPDGKETVIGLCTEGDMFGEAALFANTPYPYHAYTLGGEALLSSVAAPAMQALAASDNDLAQSLLFMMNARVAQSQLKLEQMTTMSAAQRLGCFFLRLCHAREKGEKTLQIPIDKHILAAYLGMKPETLSRTQQQLKAVGVVVAGHGVTVANVSALRHFVCESCSESGACAVEAALDR